MYSLEEKLKQFTHTKTEGPGYPRGYKSKINAFMEGYNSGRFGAYKDDNFVKTRQFANYMLEHYNNMIKEDWKTAKQMAVDTIINIEADIIKNQLLYGKDVENEIDVAKKEILHFICWSLPKLDNENNI